MSILKSLLTFIIVMFISACASDTSVKFPTIKNMLPQLSAAEVNLLGEDVEWGIALSGGGVRSAAFQIGLLKQLYDQSLSEIKGVSLNDIKLISAVSGGGYAAHLIYSNYDLLNKGISAFGSTTFDDRVFAQSICSFYTKGNFVVYPKWLISRMWLTDYYEQQIKRTFAPDILSMQGLNISLADITPYVKNHDVPYPIYNFTVNGGDTWKSRLYEVTPIQQGNEFIDYPEYQEEPLTISRAATISGAAIETLLKQEIDAPPSAIEMYGKKLVVHDGGKSENLGAIALIRRGIPNVIVSDAEHDPKLEYGGLEILFKGLIEEGFTITQILPSEFSKEYPFNSSDVVASPDFDITEHMSLATLKKEGFSHFSVNKGETSTQMFYIKMQKPTDIFPDYDDPVRKVNSQIGWRSTNAINEAIKVKRGHNCENADINDSNIVFADINENPSYSKWLRNVMWDYDYFLEKGTGLSAIRAKAKISVLNLFSKINDETELLNYSFPHISTTDQSFPIDQSIALVGLGYHQAKLLMPYIKNQIQEQSGK